MSDPETFPLASLRVRKRPSAPFFAVTGVLLALFTGFSVLRQGPHFFAAAPIALAVWIALVAWLWSPKKGGAIALTPNGIRLRERDYAFDALKSARATDAGGVLLREANDRETTLRLATDAAAGAADRIAQHVETGKTERTMVIDLVPNLRTLAQMLLIAAVVVALTVVASFIDGHLWTHGASIATEVLGVVLFLAPIVLGFAFCIRAANAQAFFGDDGVCIEGAFRPRILAWSAIGAIDVSKTALKIRLAGDNRPIALRVDDLPPVEVDALIARIENAAPGVQINKTS